MKETGMILIEAGFTTDEAYQRMLDMAQRINGREGFTKLDFETMLNDGSWWCIFNRINRLVKAH